ncbi:MAG: phage major capsid protein [Bdellovibrionales bacterium]
MDYDLMEMKSGQNALADAFEQHKEESDAAFKNVNDTLRQIKTAAARPATPTNTAQPEKGEETRRFLKYVKTGIIEDDNIGGTKSLLVGSDPDGGFAVSAEIGEMVLNRLNEATPMRQLANVLSINSDAIELLRDASDAAADWVGETESRAETDAGSFGRIRIAAHELHAQPQLTQKLLDDASVNMEEFIVNKIADRFARRENAAFISGTGVNQPRGIATYSTAATADDSRDWGVFEHVKTGANGAFAGSNPADTLISVMYKLKSGYMNGASWLMPRAVADDIRKFKDTTGQYIWQPGLSGEQQATLLGFPVVLCEDMPAKGTGSLSVAFGNFREAYTIVDRLGLRIFRDPYTAAPFVKFRCSKRVGGDVTNFDAIKFVNFAS